MLFIRARLFLRLFFLVVAVISIVFFYILGYKYDPELGFIKNSGVYSFESFSELEKIAYINWKAYNLIEGKLDIYTNLDTKCGEFKIGDFNKFVCYHHKHYTKIVYIPKYSIRFYKTSNNIFSKLVLYKWADSFVKYYFYWNDIKFTYYENGLLTYKDDLWEKTIIKLKGLEFLGYDDNGLYVLRDNILYYLQLKTDNLY